MIAIEARETILAKLEQGESLVRICQIEGMPDRRTVQRWQDAEPEWDAAVTRAREMGFEARGIQAVEDAKKADDAQKARLAFDAERWYLGKLSNAFSDDKTKKHELSGPGGQAITMIQLAPLTSDDATS